MNADFFDARLTLSNDSHILKSSRLEDAEELYALADSRIWAHSSTSIHTRADMEAYLKRAISDRIAGIRHQFTIYEKTYGKALGCSSFEHISATNLRLEIGWTWLGLQYQGKGHNGIVKHLMLAYAFDDLGFERVEFRTRGTNLQSQRALEKLGASKEGRLRSYFVGEGQRHDMVYYSILRCEWPALCNR
ncbi:MAG: GNAT family N-acetyltransferase [Saprospiraceae bacterium]|nr:GNAT family N-acetyltransferase [Saprospiraceae bacterium]